MAEIETRFKDVARSVAQDPEIREVMDEGDPHLAADRIMQHLSSMTLADILKECVRDSDKTEMEMLLEEMDAPPDFA